MRSVLSSIELDTVTALCMEQMPIAPNSLGSFSYYQLTTVNMHARNTNCFHLHFYERVMDIHYWAGLLPLKGIVVTKMWAKGYNVSNVGLTASAIYSGICFSIKLHPGLTDSGSPKLVDDEVESLLITWLVRIPSARNLLVLLVDCCVQGDVGTEVCDCSCNSSTRFPTWYLRRYSSRSSCLLILFAYVPQNMHWKCRTMPLLFWIHLRIYEYLVSTGWVWAQFRTQWTCLRNS